MLLVEMLVKVFSVLVIYKFVLDLVQFHSVVLLKMPHEDVSLHFNEIADRRQWLND